MRKWTLFVYIRLAFESQFELAPKHLNERRSCLPYDPKIMV